MVFVYWQTEWITLGVGVVTLAVLVAAAFIAYRQVNQAHREHRYQVLKDLSILWESEALIESRWRVNEAGRTLTAKLTAAYDEDLKDFYILIRVAAFFQDVGNLAAVKLIGLEDVTEYSPQLRHYWGLYRDFIKHEQTRPGGDPDFFQKFEELAEDS